LRSAADRILRRGRVIVPVLLGFALLVSFLLAQSARDEEDWASSPEASFLTAAERAEWKTLDSRDSRQKFIERYWLKRDPSPGSERNEFREMVLGRIKTADQRFGIKETAGSRTARGLVWIVLGRPARVQNQIAAPPGPDPVVRRPGLGFTPVAIFEGSDTTETWLYEPDRTPQILQLLRRPSVQIKIVLEPSRRSDAIQDPALFNDFKEIVSRASITNPDLVPGASESSAASTDLPLTRQPLSAEVHQLLESAPPNPRSEGGFAGSAVLFREAGQAETVVWAFAPSISRRAVLHTLVRREGGQEVTTSSEPAELSSAFSTLAGGAVALRRLSLPAGSYRASVALVEENGKRLVVAELPLQVPSLEKGFAVSSLIVTRGPARASEKGDRIFTLSGTALPPRADAAFTSSESLWYFVEVANPTDPAKVLLEPRLRRNGQPLGAPAPFVAALQPLGAARYLAGVELPLSSLGPADYVLYLSVRDGEGQSAASALRRAEFQVVR
jgi:GWxTD domain-containing protein